jgi:hypothetical protein
MANPMSANWPSSWPKYLPLPTAIPRSRGAVPNASSVNWPQSQFASLYLNPGSASFQPYSYLKNNVTLRSIQPTYTAIIPGALGPASVNAYKGGPGGDIARLPLGGLMHHNPRLSRKQKHLLRRALQVEAATRHAQSLQPVVRKGLINTGIPIEHGVPNTSYSLMPEPVATAGMHSMYSGLALDNMGGLALDNMGALALDNPGVMDWAKENWMTLTVAAVVAGGLYVAMGRRNAAGGRRKARASYYSYLN